MRGYFRCLFQGRSCLEGLVLIFFQPQEMHKGCLQDSLDGCCYGKCFVQSISRLAQVAKRRATVGSYILRSCYLLQGAGVPFACLPCQRRSHQTLFIDQPTRISLRILSLIDPSYNGQSLCNATCTTSAGMISVGFYPMTGSPLATGMKYGPA